MYCYCVHTDYDTVTYPVLYCTVCTYTYLKANSLIDSFAIHPVPALRACGGPAAAGYQCIILTGQCGQWPSEPGVCRHCRGALNSCTVTAGGLHSAGGPPATVKSVAVAPAGLQVGSASACGIQCQCQCWPAAGARLGAARQTN